MCVCVCVYVCVCVCVSQMSSCPGFGCNGCRGSHTEQLCFRESRDSDRGELDITPGHKSDEQQKKKKTSGKV